MLPKEQLQGGFMNINMDQMENFVFQSSQFEDNFQHGEILDMDLGDLYMMSDEIPNINPDSWLMSTEIEEISTLGLGLTQEVRVANSVWVSSLSAIWVNSFSTWAKYW